MKFRRSICILMCITVLILTAGCSGGDDKSVRNNNTNGVEDVLQQKMDEADNADKIKVESPAALEDAGSRQSGVDEGAPTPDAVLDTADLTADEDESSDPAADESKISAPSADGLDVDLTALSSTMVYSEVYNMMVMPEDYIGKTVKMEGIFSSFCDESTGKYYFACIIMDATACCSQGIEFELEGDHKYPEDYPEPGDEVCVVGTFDTYQEGEYTYCTLRNARML